MAVQNYGATAQKALQELAAGEPLIQSGQAFQPAAGGSYLQGGGGAQYEAAGALEYVQVAELALSAFRTVRLGTRL